MSMEIHYYRLEAGLRSLVKTCISQEITLGGKTFGSLKSTSIDTYTKFFGNAVRNNKGNVAEMKKAIYATIYHCSSTDEKPHHEKCSTGPNSWCFYQAEKAKNLQPGSHSSNIKTPMKSTVLKHILTV